MMPFEVQQNEYSGRRVKLSASSLSPLLMVDIPSGGGYPPFSAALHIKTLFAPAGTYTVKLMSETEGHKSKEYLMDVKVKGFTDRECTVMFRDMF